MAKKPIDKTELRKWCIEQAIRWPTEGGYNQVMSGGGGYKTEVDLIARARKILDWVLTEK